MTQYIGEIRVFAGTFAPAGWSFCDGSLLPISQNDTLFTLIGTTFGGDGSSTFGLPDLRGRSAISIGTGPGLTPMALGASGGSTEVTLQTMHLPVHSHSYAASTAAGTAPTPAADRIKATAGAMRGYQRSAPDEAFAPAAMTPAGGSQPHQNRMPYQGLNHIIALEGLYPPFS